MASVDDILDGHLPEVREIFEGLRDLLREVMPEAVEKAYPGWHGIGYRHPRAGYVCGIFPREDLVKLGFEHGVHLPDPEGLLAGSGSRVRYVVVDRWPTEQGDAIEALVEAAVGLLS